MTLSVEDRLAILDLLERQDRLMDAGDAEGLVAAFTDDAVVEAGWPGRFRSLGDGQIDFRGIFSKFAQYGFDGWAVLEWECCLKHPEQGAAEGAPFIADHMIRVTDKAFDDFAGAAPDAERNRRILGLP